MLARGPQTQIMAEVTKASQWFQAT